MLTSMFFLWNQTLLRIIHAEQKHFFLEKVIKKEGKKKKKTDKFKIDNCDVSLNT